MTPTMLYTPPNYESWFDSCDCFYLANTFIIAQLRHEIRRAELASAIVRQFGDDPELGDPLCFPWQDFADCCREAITWQRNNVKKTPPTLGRIDTEAIKAQHDIVAEIERYTTLRQSGNRFIGCCPIHNEKHPSLTVYPDQQSWRCYGCNRGGDVIDFIGAVENVDFKGAAIILGGQ
ncbi:CHC2 zinc finger domain-containing protein [Chloroflexota bacterium]